MDKKTLPNDQLFISMALSAWKVHNDRLNKLLGKLSDEQLTADIAPGRNSGTYLLGHLTAVHDNMLPLLGLSEKIYPELEIIFEKSPDKAHKQPSITDIKKYWNDVSAKLNKHLDELKADEWFNRHNAVSETDFAKEPHRNKLNLLINRTNHLSYHYGQMILLGKSSEN
jgi:uncharacterized damage-inducible protein DinB